MRAIINKVGLVLNIKRPEAREVGREISQVARNLGCELFLEKETAEFLGKRGLPLSQLVRKVKGLIVAGGDGTLLSLVGLVAKRQCPVLGINLGSLGFLTSTPRSRTQQGVKDFLSGDWLLDERTLLEVWVKRGKQRQKKIGLALNEALFTRKHGSLLAHLSVRIGSDLVTNYFADGIIIATPTGSTAYSLSANGAVVTPNAPVLILTPICPHTLTNRPVIFSDQSIVSVKPERGDSLRLTLDGRRETVLTSNCEAEISLAKEKLQLVMPRGYRFFEVLRRKLDWRGSNVT
jgi:NAD+ kinase